MWAPGEPSLAPSRRLLSTTPCMQAANETQLCRTRKFARAFLRCRVCNDGKGFIMTGRHAVMLYLIHSDQELLILRG